MKRLVLILFIPLFAFACTDDSLPEIPKPIHYHRNPAPEPPEPEPEEGGSIPIVFSGSFGDAVQSRTSLDGGGAISWSAGDRIMVLWGGGFNYASTSAAGTNAEFSTEVNESDMYWAVFPSSLDASVRSGALSLTIPDRQHGRFDNANIAVASVSAGNTDLVFHNLCGLGAFTLSRSDIAKIVFRGLGGEVLAGNAALSISGEGIPTVTGTSSPVDSIAVVPVTGSSFAAGTYYFSAIPGSLGNGVSFTLTTASGGTIIGKSIPTPDALNRSEIRSFGTLDAEGSASSITLRFTFGPESGTKAIWDPDSKWPEVAGTDDDQTTGVNYPYSLDGVEYNFFVKDLSGEGKCSWLTNNSAGYADRIGIPSSTVYFGLPAIADYKLTSVVVGQSRRGSADNAPEKVTSVGITDSIPKSAGASKTYVSGGELQNWPGWAGKADKNVVERTFSLSDTEEDTIYYLNSDNAAIGLYFSRLVLTYEK
ncbi:MAG: hypothetical protein IJ686_00730 [Bacteroidales bacterium]|nr:hypothetical protein [Bacteroidales bacterium]